MDQNPYQSPRVGDPVEEQPLGDPGSVRQLLMEIRDAQLEMLRLSREAHQRTKTAIWYRVPFSIVFAIILLTSVYFSVMTRQRILQQIPPRPAPRAVP